MMDALARPLDDRDLRLLNRLQAGLPRVSHPYAAIGVETGHSESEVLDKLQHWLATGLIKRFGVIVKHRSIGYESNAMVVFDLPDDAVAGIGKALADYPFITLCYRRPRIEGRWPYNLFCMIHGKDRSIVLKQLKEALIALGIDDCPHEVLFSSRCFKQRGARYTVNRESAA
jgi:DNA-binding Lrp family transcriptional regulator